MDDCCPWRTLIYGWLVHKEPLSMVDCCPWRTLIYGWLVQGEPLSMDDCCPWRILIYGWLLFMKSSYPWMTCWWRTLIHGGLHREPLSMVDLSMEIPYRPLFIDNFWPWIKAVHQLPGYYNTNKSNWWRQTNQKPWSWYIFDYRENKIVRKPESLLEWTLIWLHDRFHYDILGVSYLVWWVFGAHLCMICLFALYWHRQQLSLGYHADS